MFVCACVRVEASTPPASARKAAKRAESAAMPDVFLQPFQRLQAQLHQLETENRSSYLSHMYFTSTRGWAAGDDKKYSSHMFHSIVSAHFRVSTGKRVME